MIFAPDADFDGAATFTFTANDGSGVSNEATVSITVTSTIFAHWPFDEGAGTTAADVSGNGYTGTLSNGAAWTTGALSKAVSLDGVNDYVDVGVIDVAGTAMTLAGWFNSSHLALTTYHDGRIISKATGTAEADHYWMLSTTRSGSKSRLWFRLKTGGVTDTLIASSGNLPANQWLHAAAVYDGVTMKLYSLDEANLPPSYQGCCTLDDVEDARMVCRSLGIPHYVLNVQQEFQEHVIDYFRREYSKGRTPHPCIACNDKIKFSHLMERAAVLEADYVATGHYAQIERTPSGIVLKKAVDASKDQSYVLFGMGQDQLAHTLMPVGAYPKSEIRQMAEDAKLLNAAKPDSQDICFIPSGDYKSFLKKRLDTVPGDIVELDETVVGRHEGIEYFTIGQRQIGRAHV